jgi:hypothetical protein
VCGESEEDNKRRKSAEAKLEELQQSGADVGPAEEKLEKDIQQY